VIDIVPCDFTVWLRARLNRKVPLSMYTRFTVALIAVGLGACNDASVPLEQTFTDPVTGSKTPMSVLKLGQLEVAAMRDKPEGFGTVTIRGKPVVGYLCMPDESCDIYVFDASDAAVTVRTRARGAGLKAVEVNGSKWLTWDTNADGQVDTRVHRGSDSVEIWIDGQWLPRTTTGVGKDRQYFSGNREVVWTEEGWMYRGT
jgi:hypothetical protein